MKKNTIAAITTALSNAGIGIIRISGEEAFQIANEIFVNKFYKKELLNYESHTIHYGFIMENENIVDEVMISVMKAPKSYTTENTVEINCHGGIIMMNKILDLVIKNGARIAEPGEFTKRAFLNGRIDLSKAEAVMDIIQSKNDFALGASVKQLKGSLSRAVKILREKILYEIAFIESALDDPEHISLDGYLEELKIKIKNIKNEIYKLIKNADQGKIIKEGIHTVIVGKPNAGKSSFLNILLGEERAIVTEVAGTTRDILEESVKIGNIVLNLIDTAGIRNTQDIVEKIGVEKAKKYAGEADLIVFVVDSSVTFDENDRKILEIISGKNVIVLLNKTDLNQIITEDNMKLFLEGQEFSKLEILKTSTKENIGINEFEQTIEKMFFDGDIMSNDEIYITNLRHKEALMETYDSLTMVEKSISEEMPEDFLSIDLMSAYSSLGFIIGEEVEDDLVTEIFSKFCMGK